MVVVAVSRSSFGARALGALALIGAPLAAGCEQDASPAGPVVTPPGELGAARVEPATPAPSAAAFDVGEVKSAAEYSQDPEFAAADLRRGELLALACAACHAFGAGQPTIVGPSLHGRRPAGRPRRSRGSSTRRRCAASLTWTPKALDAWLADPSRFVAGTTMTFTGYRAADDRRDLIAYLLRATQ